MWNFFSEYWVGRLTLNLLGYASVLLPGYLLLRYVTSRGLFLDEYHSWKSRLVNQCFRGAPYPNLEEQLIESKPKVVKTTAQRAWTLLMCVGGLQVFYLTWGVLQEKIMTKDYTSYDGTTLGTFKDAQFVVLVNRVLAFVLALTYISVTEQPTHRAPFYKYSYCSLSNIMSSWCQYEALKYVSFPTQVLSKASKIIPVMIMGKFVSKKTYPFYEYVIALTISFGMFIFLYSSSEEKRGTLAVTTISGYILLCGYLVFDSFTSNWQSELFQVYKMSSFQMMCGVNLFSCLLLTASLLQQGTMFDSVAFMIEFPSFALDCIILSLCSAGGQFFVFFTISEFGPVVFVIISTVRQALSILLSVIIYGHLIGVMGIIGISIVFTSVFVKTYIGHRMRGQKRPPSPSLQSSPDSSPSRTPPLSIVLQK